MMREDVISANQKEKNMDTVLHIALQAAFEGASLEPIRRLLTDPAIKSLIQIPNQKGETPLHLAVCLKDGVDIVSDLFALDADPMLTQQDGQLPLHYAASVYRNQEMVKLLVAEAGRRSINHRDNKGRTALHVAALAARRETVEFLLENRADVNAVDQEGNTPLHLVATRFAVTPGDAESKIIKALLSHRADAALYNEGGLTARALAFPAKAQINDDTLLQEMANLLTLAEAGQLQIDSEENRQLSYENTKKGFVISSPSTFSKASSRADQKVNARLIYLTNLNKIKNTLVNVLADDISLANQYHTYFKSGNHHPRHRFAILYHRYQATYGMVFTQEFDKWLSFPEQLLLQEDASFVLKEVKRLELILLKQVGDKLRAAIQQQYYLRGTTDYNTISGETSQLTIENATVEELSIAFGKEQVKAIQTLSVAERLAKAKELDELITQLQQEEQRLVAIHAFYHEIEKRINYITLLRSLLALAPTVDIAQVDIMQMLQEGIVSLFKPLVQATYQAFQASYKKAVESKFAGAPFTSAAYQALDKRIAWWRAEENSILALDSLVEEATYFYAQYQRLQAHNHMHPEDIKTAKMVAERLTTNPPLRHVQAKAEGKALAQEDSLSVLRELHAMYAEDFLIIRTEKHVDIILPDVDDDRYGLSLSTSITVLQSVLQDLQQALANCFIQLNLTVEMTIEHNKLILSVDKQEAIEQVVAFLERENLTITPPLVEVNLNEEDAEAAASSGNGQENAVASQVILTNHPAGLFNGSGLTARLHHSMTPSTLPASSTRTDEKTRCLLQ